MTLTECAFFGQFVLEVFDDIRVSRNLSQIRAIPSLKRPLISMCCTNFDKMPETSHSLISVTAASFLFSAPFQSGIAKIRFTFLFPFVFLSFYMLSRYVRSAKRALWNENLTPPPPFALLSWFSGSLVRGMSPVSYLRPDSIIFRFISCNHLSFSPYTARCCGVMFHGEAIFLC